MTHLYFIRHGLSQLNTEGKLAGVIDTPLTDEGRAQATAAGKAAWHLGIEYIISSPLSRTLDTAKLIAKEIGYDENKIEVNPLFVERNFGVLEGQPYKADIDYDGIVDAEKTSDLLNRSERAIRYLESLPYEKILVVSHGSFGRALRHHVVPEHPFHYPLKYHNAKLVTWIITSKGRVPESQ